MVLAGFRKVPTPLQIAKRAWAKMSKEERDEFTSWISETG
jgi:hypothetical protein